MPTSFDGSPSRGDSRALTVALEAVANRFVFRQVVGGAACIMEDAIMGTSSAWYLGPHMLWAGNKSICT